MVYFVTAESKYVRCCTVGGGGRGQHVWGAGGQRLVGEILEDVVLPHQNQDPRQLAGQMSFSLFYSCVNSLLYVQCHHILSFFCSFIPSLSP